MIRYFCLFLITMSIFQVQAQAPAENSAKTENSIKTENSAKTETNSEPAKKTESEPYKTPLKGNIDNELLRSAFATPEQMSSAKKNQTLWMDNLKLGFQIRPRFESRQNADFNKTTDDYSNFTGQNTQVWFILDPSPYFSAKVTIQDVRLWGGSQNSGVGGDIRFALANNAGKEITPGSTTSSPTVVRSNTDVREAFIILKKTDINPFNIQIGRQIFAYGDLKILGPLNWANNGYSFDGVRFMYDSKYFSSHVFGSTLSEQHDAPGGLLTANGRTRGSIDDAYFTGTYNTIKPTDLFWIDLYAFGLHKKWIPATSPAYNLSNAQIMTEDRSRQRDNLATGGFRITNRIANNTLPKTKSWDWTIESAWQTGYNGERVNASWDTIGMATPDGKKIFTERVKYDSRFMAVETGYLITEKIRLGVNYHYASGDPNRSDSRVGTWQPLFPQIAGAFPYWNTMNGQSTIVGFQNIKSYSAKISIKTEKFGQFIFAGYDILKAKSQDAWYNVQGAAVAGGSSENKNNERFKYDQNAHLGKRLFYQYDITWIYNYSEYISIWAGFSLIQAQDAIRNIRDIPEIQKYTFEPTSRYMFFMVSAVM